MSRRSRCARSVTCSTRRRRRTSRRRTTASRSARRGAVSAIRRSRPRSSSIRRQVPGLRGAGRRAHGAEGKAAEGQRADRLAVEPRERRADQDRPRRRHASDLPRQAEAAGDPRDRRQRSATWSTRTRRRSSAPTSTRRSRRHPVDSEPTGTAVAECAARRAADQRPVERLHDGGVGIEARGLRRSSRLGRTIRRRCAVRNVAVGQRLVRQRRQQQQAGVSAGREGGIARPLRRRGRSPRLPQRKAETRSPHEARA